MTEVQTDTRCKILLIDDDEGIGLAIKRMLRKQYDVTVTTSGEDGLNAIDEEGFFDAIICDFMMPGMTGMEVYKRVIDTAPELSQRFLFVSGGISSEKAKEFIASVPCKILKKPMHPDALRAELTNIVGQSRP